MSTKRESSKNNQELQTSNKVFIALLLVAFILPWPHGGELAWQYFIFCISIFSLSAIYFIYNVSNKNNQFSVFKNIKTPLILLCVCLLFQVVQVIPLPIDLSNVADQNRNPNNWQTISIAPNVTLVEIIKHTSYITVFILTLLLLNTKKRIVKLANTLFISSALIAVYSLVNHYTHGAFSLIDSIPPWTSPWKDVTHGTFSYQNHYASFLTITIPLGYGLLYSNIKNNPNQKIGKAIAVKVIDLLMSINGIYLLSLLIMTIALLKTASRGGNSIFIISIAITFLCVLFQQKKPKKEKVKRIILLIIGMLTISIVVIATGVTDSLTKRLTTQGYTPNGRDLMYQTAFAIIQERPIIGSGAGTYPILQHKYKSPMLGNSPMSKRAHNEYLELLTNQGVIGFSLLAAAIFLLYIRLLKGLKKNKKNSDLYGFQVASFCSVTSIILHSFADFNFHLPANTVFFYMILAVGIKLNLSCKKFNRITNE